MGQIREYNPKMVTEWHHVPLLIGLGARNLHWKEMQEILDKAKEWCLGSMIHGRFCAYLSWKPGFFFKSKKDAMLFKLTWGGDI
jgi:hypothetical protein